MKTVFCNMHIFFHIKYVRAPVLESSKSPSAALSILSGALGLSVLGDCSFLLGRPLLFPINNICNTITQEHELSKTVALRKHENGKHVL